MFSRLIIALLAAAAIAGQVTHARAQGGAVLHADPFFRSLNLADGLPSSEVAKIVEDHDGFIWIATHDGLVRYDGVGFRVWRHDDADAASISSDDVAIIFVDRANRIWCGGESSGLNMLDAGRRGFTHFSHREKDPGALAEADVWSIGEDAQGAIWVGGPTAGLSRLDEASGTFAHFHHADADRNSVGADRIFSIFRDDKGRLWVGHTRGVDRLAPDGRFEHADFAAVPGEERINAFSLTADAEGRVLAATRRGVVRIGADLKASLVVGSAMSDSRALSLARTPSNELWVGTLHGLNHVDAQGNVIGKYVQDPLRTGSLPADYVQDAFVDHEGGLWFATQGGGVARLPAQWQAFSIFRSVPGGAETLASDRVQNLAEGRDGRILAVSEDGAIERIDAASGRVEHLAGKLPVAEKLLESILVGHDGQIWVGHVRGLRIYRGGQFVDVAASAEDTSALLPGKIDMLREAADGSVWARSWGSGIDRIDATTQKIERFEGEAAGLRGPDVSQIEFDPYGVLLASMSAGIDRFDPATRRFAPLAGMNSQRILAFAFASDGSLWVHSQGVLEHYDYRDGIAKQKERVGADAGWPTLSTGAMQVDASGRLWVTSARGLWRFDPATRAVRQFDTHDGLASSEFVVAPMLKRSDGSLFAATHLGIVGFRPERIGDSGTAGPVVLDTLVVRRDGHDVSLDALLPVQALRWDDRDLRIGARLLTFTNAAANRYQWRLDGVDADWVDSANRGEREYSQLPPGIHRLHVRAQSANGPWKEIAPLKFDQAAPPWRTPWAYALYALVLGVAGWLASRGYRRRIEARHAYALAEQQRRFAEQASAAKTDFLATMGHEIRTPMTGVLGMAELLLRTPLDERQRSYAEAIESSGHVMLRLINDSLDLARIEAGKLALEIVRFDLRALVREIATLAQPLATRKGLAFDCTVAAAVPPSVEGDAVRIRQVFLNLVNNAIKFTAHGRIDLALDCAADGALRFSVRDTGPGISAAARERLFNRFEQAEGAQRFGGSGLGLAICRELVARMHGEIELDSTPGVGSTFTVTLPLAAASSEDAPSGDDTSLTDAMTSTASDQERVADIRALKVLLVEDDPTVATVIAGQLEARGANVRIAAQGLAALSELALAEFDIALLDLDLPGLDGLALARTLRAREVADGRARLPLIGISARSAGDEEALCIDAGMDAFLRKPISGEQLARAIAANAASPANRNV